MEHNYAQTIHGVPVQTLQETVVQPAHKDRFHLNAIVMAPQEQQATAVQKHTRQLNVFALNHGLAVDGVHAQTEHKQELALTQAHAKQQKTYHH